VRSANRRRRSEDARVQIRLRAALLLIVAACGSDEDYSDLDDIENMPTIDGKADGASAWSLVGVGVAYQQVNTGHAILIAYGGYSARLSDSGSWATELVDQKLGAADVGHIFAVRGPADPGYAAKEIQNTKLRAKLATFDDGISPIYVVAHSSGSYVAHELFGQLRNATPGKLQRIAYADLDGGGSGLTSAIVSALGEVEFVYARDPNLSSGLSKNASTAMALASAYAPNATAFEVRVPNTGCNSGAGWCLHDVVITHRPHNPNTFDLARDYTDFVNRSVTTEYLDPFLQ
jgi:hypothetical protein